MVELQILILSYLISNNFEGKRKYLYLIEGRNVEILSLWTQADVIPFVGFSYAHSFKLLMIRPSQS